MPLVMGRGIKCCCFSPRHVPELVVIKTLNLSASCVVQGAIPGAEGDRRAEAGVVHQILLLLSTNAYKHTDTHIHIQQLQVHFISTSLLLIHICLLPRLKHTHTHKQRTLKTDKHINRHMGSSPARPFQTLPQSSTKKCFSNTCLTSSQTLACRILFV